MYRDVIDLKFLILLKDVEYNNEYLKFIHVFLKIQSFLEIKKNIFVLFI